jgi:hypothetical protein
MMSYNVTCDRCRFARDVDDWVGAQAAARDHEADHPTHIVDVHERDPA